MYVSGHSGTMCLQFFFMYVYDLCIPTVLVCILIRTFADTKQNSFCHSEETVLSERREEDKTE